MILTFSFSHNCAFVYFLRNTFQIICLFGLGLFPISFWLQPANSKKLKSAIVHCIFLTLPSSLSLPPSAPPSPFCICVQRCAYICFVYGGWSPMVGGWLPLLISTLFSEIVSLNPELMIQFSWMEGISYPRDSSVTFFLVLELQVHTPTPAWLFM